MPGLAGSFFRTLNLGNNEFSFDISGVAKGAAYVIMECYTTVYTGEGFYSMVFHFDCSDGEVESDNLGGVMELMRGGILSMKKMPFSQM